MARRIVSDTIMHRTFEFLRSYNDSSCMCVCACVHTHHASCAVYFAVKKSAYYAVISLLGYFSVNFVALASFATMMETLFYHCRLRFFLLCIGNMSDAKKWTRTANPLSCWRLCADFRYGKVHAGTGDERLRGSVEV